MRRLISFSVLALSLTACASHKPIVDTKGVNMALYERDLAECTEYAEQVESGEKVAKSAAVGAAVGAAIGAVFGNAGDGAATGAIDGGTHGGLDADREKAAVVKRCLRGRGYRVLN
ncbi:MAG: glycine zipper family protein [Xanthomonadales bacterium]|nr:glycine zipper family protein [Gammaproteobacteria bacterium]NNE05168.1 glycine zipper family protein [Xanthomonadales bacterium]NNL94937.1 glycine zipper family protein [Xanthomonadales bacterium]